MPAPSTLHYHVTIYYNEVHACTHPPACTHAVGIHPEIHSGLPHNSDHNDITLAQPVMASKCAEANASIARSLIRMWLIWSLSVHSDRSVQVQRQL